MDEAQWQALAHEKIRQADRLLFNADAEGDSDVRVSTAIAYPVNVTNIQAETDELEFEE